MSDNWNLLSPSRNWTAFGLSKDIARCLSIEKVAKNSRSSSLYEGSSIWTNLSHFDVLMICITDSPSPILFNSDNVLVVRQNQIDSVGVVEEVQLLVLKFFQDLME